MHECDTPQIPDEFWIYIDGKKWRIISKEDFSATITNSFWSNDFTEYTIHIRLPHHAISQVADRFILMDVSMRLGTVPSSKSVMFQLDLYTLGGERLESYRDVHIAIESPVWETYMNSVVIDPIESFVLPLYARKSNFLI